LHIAKGLGEQAGKGLKKLGADAEKLGKEADKGFNKLGK
jgi:hypothetical protein